MWWKKDCSINGLYNELYKNDKLRYHLKLENDKLSFEFHKNFKLEVKFNGVYFNVYINDKFDYNIEEQDILEYIEEIKNDNYVFVEYKSKRGFFHRRYFDIVLKDKFSIEDFRRVIKKIEKIYTIDNVLFENI